MEYEASEKAIRDYNQAIYEAEQRGEARGAARTSRLYRLLLEDKRYEDLKRVAADMKYQQGLMKEYGI